MTGKRLTLMSGRPCRLCDIQYWSGAETLPIRADTSTRTRVRNRVLVYSSIVVLLLFASAALGGVLAPTEALDEPQWWPGLCFVVLPVVLAVRGVFTGVVVADSDVVIRGWLRTRRVLRSQALGVTTMRYSGVWNRGSESRVFRMLAIKTVDGTIEVPAVAARELKAERLASVLKKALFLPE